MSEHCRYPVPLALIIMGVSGCGKTTLGIELSRALTCIFIEGDRFHAPQSIAKMRAGRPLTDDDRWSWLDRIADAITAEIETGKTAVAACSALKRSYRDCLRQRIGGQVRFVFLDGERDELWRRLSSRSGHYMPASLLSSQIETLQRPEPDEHILRLDAQQPTSILCQRVVAWLCGEH